MASDRGETRVREALTCSRNSFACVHGDHEIDAADLRALLSEVAALRRQVSEMEYLWRDGDKDVWDALFYSDKEPFSGAVAAAYAQARAAQGGTDGQL